ncbi:hypothetical protein ES702_06095 [subsurface metagenome]
MAPQKHAPVKNGVCSLLGLFSVGPSWPVVDGEASGSLEVAVDPDIVVKL